jgi:hypothetical protein
MMRKLLSCIAAASLATTVSSAALAQVTTTTVWSSTEGELTLTQQGQTTTGSYSGGGRIVATLANRHLQGFWIEPQSATRCSTQRNGSFFWGRIDLAMDGTSFTGRRSYCDRPALSGDRAWSGTLLRANVAGMPGVTRNITLPTRAGAPIVSVSAGPRPGGAAGAPRPAPSTTAPCYSNSYAVANIGPCTSRVGSTLTIRRLRTTPTPLGSLVFKAVLANGVPAQVTAPLAPAGGSIFNAVVPAQLCAQGGPKWDVWLRTADGQNQGSIGSFQPDCR